MLAKNLFTVNATGLDAVILRDDVNGQVPFIRKGLLEQREADLLKQLEIAEDTVDVLEQLLQKYGAEILRLRAYNDALRQLNPPLPVPAPLPPNHPFVWPNQQQPIYPWNDMNKVWCEATERQQFLDFLSNASKIVDSWPDWKKAGLQGMMGEF